MENIFAVFSENDSPTYFRDKQKAIDWIKKRLTRSYQAFPDNTIFPSPVYYVTGVTEDGDGALKFDRLCYLYSAKRLRTNDGTYQLDECFVTTEQKVSIIK
jgi:hypothetical protein